MSSPLTMNGGTLPLPKESSSSADATKALMFSELASSSISAVGLTTGEGSKNVEREAGSKVERKSAEWVASRNTVPSHNAGRQGSDQERFLWYDYLS